MAAGRPIVSFAGAAGILEHESTALLVADGDVNAFAEATMQLLSHPELGQRLGANAQRLVTNEYSWSQAAARVEAVYDNVLAAQARCGDT